MGEVVVAMFEDMNRPLFANAIKPAADEAFPLERPEGGYAK